MVISSPPHSLPIFNVGIIKPETVCLLNSNFLAVLFDNIVYCSRIVAYIEVWVGKIHGELSSRPFYSYLLQGNLHCCQGDRPERKLG